MKKLLASLLAILMSLSCFSLISFATATETTAHITEVPEGYKGVYTVEDLYFVRNDLTANYILMNDIDLSEATAEGGDWNYGGRGWNPIGSNDIYSNGAFSGIFEGNNYSVTGMNIDIDAYPAGTGNDVYVGLFANVSGTVKNLTVEGRITTERIETYSYSGGAIAHHFGGISAYVTSGGVIQNCKNKVNIYICAPHKNGGSYAVVTSIGGISGSSYGEIVNCANYADINAKIYSQISAYGRISGITGYGSVSKCINNGDITAINGGAKEISTSVFVNGITSAEATDCYNAGNITAKIEKVYDKKVGITEAFGITGDIATRCYNVGKIEYAGSSYAISKSSNTSNCYYLEGTGSNSTGATSLTEAQMKLQAMYSSWDFDTVWTMEGRADYPYPELRDVPLVLPDDSKPVISGSVTVTGEATVGSTLTAEIKDLSPADATVEFIWLADGKVVGTGSSYTLTQDDAGKEITVSVKGNGEFKGEIKAPVFVGECVHAFDEFANNNDATCDKNATQTAVCLNCGEAITEEIEGTKLPHTFTTYIYDNNATCTADGTKTAKCESCDATDTVTAESTKTEHDFSDKWVIDKDATCSEEGVKSHHCKNCDATKDETALEKTNHKYASTVTEATCDKDGKIIYTCSCGDTYSKIIYAAGHKDTDGNGRCDDCHEVLESNEETEEDNENESSPACKCICHETGIFSVLYKIFSMIQRYFKIDLLGNVLKMGQTCTCGEYHY